MLTFEGVRFVRDARVASPIVAIGVMVTGDIGRWVAGGVGAMEGRS